MGLTYTEGELTGLNGQCASVRFLIDSGAIYSLVPHDIWKALDLQPKRTVTFTLTDGTSVERAVSECRISILGGEACTPVILGEPGDEALLGVVTLEILNLALNPFSRTPQPMRMMLA